jgi:uncharacterized PurR-regulated membrane protein YhhQ (DUF165 family)
LFEIGFESVLLVFVVYTKTRFGTTSLANCSFRFVLNRSNICSFYITCMIHSILKDKPTKLFISIAAFFVANALIAECIGGKIFSLEKVFGISPSNFTIFGQTGLAFNLTCGVLLWPLEFIVTDIVNEYYGPKAVKRISYTAVVLIVYAFIMFYGAIRVAPADFWIGSKQTEGIDNMQTAFGGIFGQGMWIILGSILAFLVSKKNVQKDLIELM